MTKELAHIPPLKVLFSTLLKVAIKKPMGAKGFLPNLDSPLQIFASVGRPIVPLENVPDPVFSQRIVGDGVAIDPIGNTLRATGAGKIVQLHPAKHALTIETANGYQITLDRGIDTVSMKGRGC